MNCEGPAAFGLAALGWHLLLAVKLGARVTVHSLLRGLGRASGAVGGLQESEGRGKALGCSSCGQRLLSLGATTLSLPCSSEWVGQSQQRSWLSCTL